MKHIIKSILISTLFAMSATSFASSFFQDGSPDAYNRNQSMQTGKVVEATVLQVREVSIGSSTASKAVGAGAGGIVGAALANGKSAFGMTLGGLLGGAIGSAVAAVATESTGQEVIVRMGQDVRVIVQENGRMALSPGQRVLVLLNGSQARIVGNNL